MKYLSKFNEGFNISIKQKDIDEWGISIEDIEDILIELSDHSRHKWPRYYNMEVGGCEIKSGRLQRVRYIEDNRIIIKLIPEVIVLADVRMNKSDLDMILEKIRSRFSEVGIVITDNSTSSSETEKNLHYVRIRLTKKSDVALIIRPDSRTEHIGV